MMFASLAMAIALLTCGDLDVSSQEIFSQFVAHDGVATGLAPTSVVCEATVGPVTWSGDGKFLLVERDERRDSTAYREAVSSGRTPNSKVGSIELWSVDGQAGSQAMRFDPASTKMRFGCWMAGSNVAVIDLEIRRTSGSRQEIWLCPFSARPKLLYSADQGAQATLSVAPTAPMGVLTIPASQGTDKAMSIITFGPTGEIAKPAIFPVRPDQQMVVTGFDAAGAGPYISAFVRNVDGKIERKNFIVKRGASTAEPYLGDLRIGPEVRNAMEAKRFLVKEPLASKYGDGKNALWISFGHEPDAKRLLVSTDGDAETLSPTGETVCYVHAGCLVVRRLIDIPMKSFEAGAARESQADALQVANEAARLIDIAKSMVNSRIPSLGEWDEYCNLAHVPAKIRSRFVYVGPPNNSDAKAILGYVSGIGGRAVIHVDLSVAWEPASANSIPQSG